MNPQLRFVFCGLSITSSWGNGHATTYRALLRDLSARGHDVLFLERDVPWYAGNRDLPRPPYCRVKLYKSIDELKSRFTREIRQADVVIVGSYVPEGAAVGEWVTSVARGATAFYDIDTPVTLAKLRAGDEEYLSQALIPLYNLYLSFTGGPTLRIIEKRYGSPAARVLYCSVDPGMYFAENRTPKWDCGYLGTYSQDRQRALDTLLLRPARCWAKGKYVVAGPLYPGEIEWPENVHRIDHLPPADHRKFYNSQRFTLNITRADMVRAGYSPSVRLFEAAACGTPIISDYWEGLSSIFKINTEILIARSSREALAYVSELPEAERLRIGQQARTRILAQHTSAHRAAELEKHVTEVLNKIALDKTKVRSSVARNRALELASIGHA